MWDFTRKKTKSVFLLLGIVDDDDEKEPTSPIKTTTGQKKMFVLIIYLRPLAGQIKQDKKRLTSITITSDIMIINDIFIITSVSK